MNPQYWSLNSIYLKLTNKKQFSKIEEKCNKRYVVETKNIVLHCANCNEQFKSDKNIFLKNVAETVKCPKCHSVKIQFDDIQLNHKCQRNYKFW